MKYTLRTTKLYRRNFSCLYRRGIDLRKLQGVLDILCQGIPLSPRYRQHPLLGSPGCYEIHISPDWLLWYQIDRDTIWLLRSGSHSDIH